MSELVKCATCKTEKPLSEMKTCMQADREYSVCDMPCMIKFYKGEIKPDIVITPDLEEMVRLGMNPKEYHLHKENLELTEQLAKANERVRELELHANSIADALEFNAENNNRFATSVICTNIRNLHSFSDCLSRIENAFLMVESETDEFGETSEDVAFSKWGLTPHEYCIEFGKWLNKFAIEQQIKGMQRVLDCGELNLSQGDIDTIELMQEQLRKEQDSE